MNEVSMSSGRGRSAFLCTAFFLFVAGLPSRAHAADYANLPVVKPAISCDQLAQTDLSKAADATVTFKTAVTDTPKGKFCKITGNIDPTIGFEVDLPMEHWTQRFVQAGCGAYCGNINVNINQASACLPALNGEFASASDDMGHEGGMNSPGGDSAFGADPQKKIDFAYRGNHETTLVSKALIKAFYGQPQKFAYFVGCSDGGREALTEGERYPNDFDGISAGAPVAIINVHNSFFHGGWEAAVDKRADGSTILYRERLSILHDAVVAHCGHDGTVIVDPFGCKFDPAWVECAPGAADTRKCLTSDEIGVVEKLYDGPMDAAGHLFEIVGYVPGTEPQMGIPSQNPNARAGGPGGGGGMTASSLKYLLLPTVTDEGKNFQLTEEWFKKVGELAPLYNAANTDLRPFEQHGGKLILWHGGADTSVPPTISVAYYQGVQKLLGAQVTDNFIKLFILPGVGHCGGGDGPSQVDVLTPLMAWTELHRAPTKLIAGKTAGGGGPGGPGGPGPVGPGPGVTQGAPGMDAPPRGGPGQGGPNMEGGPAGPAGPNMAGGPGGPGGGPGGGMGGGPGGSKYPYPSPAQPTMFTRPLYPYPYIARYSGNGDPTDAANYEPVKSSAPVPLVFNTEATMLIGPDNQKFYHVENGQLVVDKK